MGAAAGRAVSTKILGYFVLEVCDDYEQVLGLDNAGAAKPLGGILEWTTGPRALFPDRKSARAAINRTENYRLAFGTQHPERKLCRIVAVRMETS